MLSFHLYLNLLLSSFRDVSQLGLQWTEPVTQDHVHGRSALGPIVLSPHFHSQVNININMFLEYCPITTYEGIYIIFKRNQENH